MRSLIWAQSKNGAIGFQGRLPWKLPDDMRHFMQSTKGHPVIMGRKTFESMDKKPLPNRQNIVMTSQTDYVAPGCVVVNSLGEALKVTGADPFIIGGASLYQESLPIADRLCVTRIDAVVEGDTFFPDFDISQWKLVSSEPHSKDKFNEFDFVIEIYERRS
jgi:dihydrofolate reductase